MPQPDSPPGIASPILIAGATASGKSALALALASRVNGIVINADSMQVYRELPILTAQPTATEQSRAPHRVYGHVSARDAYSTGKYLADIARALAEAADLGCRPIIVGGTGLYFKALLAGLSPVPPIPEDVRRQWRERAMQVSAVALHQDLAARDPTMAARLNPSDRQRVTRALEVIDATGLSLAVWQERPGEPLIDGTSAIKLVLERRRDDLQARCDMRFDAMLAHGAFDEVEALAALQLSSDLPAMRALGVPPLLQALRGETTREAAVASAKLETRQYVKRQMTWLNGQMRDWRRIPPDTPVDAVLSDIASVGSRPVHGDRQ